MKRWIGCVLWLMLAALLYLMENNTGTRVVLIVSCVLPLISWWMTWISADRVICTLTVPETAVREQSSRVDVKIHGLLPLTGLRVKIACTNAFTGEQQTQQLLFWSNGTHELALRSAHMGLMELQADCRRLDLLGLYIKPQCSLQGYVLVKPMLDEAAQAAPAMAHGGSEGQKLTGGHAAEPGPELRAYQPGDALHSIHWKASQRLDQLLVRVPEQQLSSHTQLLLDATTALGITDMEQLSIRFLEASAALASSQTAHTAVWCSRAGEIVCFEVDGGADSDALMNTLLQTGVSMKTAPAAEAYALIVR